MEPATYAQRDALEEGRSSGDLAVVNARALRVLGFGTDQLRTIPADDAGRLGAAAVLSERGRARLEGIERADSLTLDPHKWFFQPSEIGGLLVRDRRWLRESFRTGAEYLSDAHRGVEDEVNLGGSGVQLTQSFRALKLWLSVKVFGLGAFCEAVEFRLCPINPRTTEADIRETLRRLVPREGGGVGPPLTPAGMRIPRCPMGSRRARTDAEGYGASRPGRYAFSIGGYE